MLAVPTLLRCQGHAANHCKVQPPQIGNWTKRLHTITEANWEDEHEAQDRPRMASTASQATSSPSPPHLAGLPECQADPLHLTHSAEDAAAVMRRLKDGCRADRKHLLTWILKALPSLASSEVGSDVVLAALEVATGPERTAFANEFQGSILNLCTSPHGHQVLVNLVQSMPVAAIGFVASEMAGHCIEIAKDRCGCCVLETMTMHCAEAQLALIAEELIQEAAELSRHPYGSSVIEHLLEYATSQCRAEVAQRLLPEVPALAMHRRASGVVEKAFKYGSIGEQQSIAIALLKAAMPASIADVACSRCGSFILEEVAKTKIYTAEFRPRLAEVLPRLRQSKFGRRVIVYFDLAVPSSADACPDTIRPHLAAVAA